MEMKDKTGHEDRSRDGLKTNQQKSLETVFKCWQEKGRIDRFEEFSQNIVTLRSSGYNRKLLTENHIDTLDWSLNRSGITFHIFTTVFIV